MKEGLTEIVFILDKSGSMSGLEKDTIGGYNSFIEKQKKDLFVYRFMSCRSWNLFTGNDIRLFVGSC